MHWALFFACQDYGFSNPDDAQGPIPPDCETCLDGGGGGGSAGGGGSEGGGGPAVDEPPPGWGESTPCDCSEGTECVTLEDGDEACATAGTSCGDDEDCATHEACVETEDDEGRCTYEPETSCTGHNWYNVVSNGQGTHLDSCMPCAYGPPQCAVSADGRTLDCTRSQGIMPREWPSLGATMDFMAVDYPLGNPFDIDRCIVAWGVHELLDPVAATNTTNLASRTILPAGTDEPFELGGLSTTLPARVFQHVVPFLPPLPTTTLPMETSERAALILWQEESAASVRSAPLPEPYAICPSCGTYEDLMEDLYPGTIFCQGLARDPADSMVAIPFYLPHYDPIYGDDSDVSITSELVCETRGGGLLRSLGSVVIPRTR